jgi:hypothetical protein
MKVFSVPDAVPFPEPDYANYDVERELARQAEHTAALKQHLIEAGYTGKHTGEIARFGVADGYAAYMLADGKGIYGSSFLIHLPYFDAYHYRHIEFLPKKEILAQIERGKARPTSIFSRKP